MSPFLLYFILNQELWEISQQNPLAEYENTLQVLEEQELGQSDKSYYIGVLKQGEAQKVTDEMYSREFAEKELKKFNDSLAKEKAVKEEVATHNVDLKSEAQTVQFVKVPEKPATPVKPELPSAVQQASMLPTTGEQSTLSIVLTTLGVLVLVILGVVIYKKRQA